ncbi:fatty acid--CoA ligase [Psychrobacter sp. Sarcosine-3u-12]|uniref:fatty acid--CoA ligase n=1 Tax=Psychrobacter sp. Sarcosine-3u-12 TaxID=2058325 RepID=UPI000C3377E0|nr:fatty acid--CoA ligase [Psychrobacter sp. Sarcosine-3u-12]PKG34114.1 long-chain fatty acid--CoA ligase [Psychrobacter sp. Sarcosine-3u-12]
MSNIYHSAPAAYEFPLLIKQLLNRAKTVSQDQEIVYADKKRFTYKDLFNRINRLANVLADLNLATGDVVAVMDWDSHRYLESYFAVPMSQYILQTVNIRLSPEKVLYTINHAKPKVLMLNSEFAALVKDYQFENSSIEHIIWLDDNGMTVEGVFGDNQKRVTGEYEALLEAADDTFDFQDFDENTIATTFYTSGTTGDPKGVFFNHRQLVLHSMAEAATLGMLPNKQGVSNGDVYMPMTPMFHVHAWGFPFTATMVGLKQVYPGRYAPDTLLDLIINEKVSITHCVPTILQMVLKEAQDRGASFNGLKMIIGGSRLTEGLAKSALAQDIEVYTGYGMSETAPLISLTEFSLNEPEMTEEEDIARRCMTGKPVVMVDAQVWGENNQSVGTGEENTGELVLRAPWLTQSYLKNDDAGKELWENGYMHTQDIAYVRPDGYIRITDRLKDVIKSGGEWISSLEIETILSLHPAVADVSVIGVRDKQWGERPLALVVLKPDCQDTKVEDIKAIAEKAVERGIIPKYGVPSQFKFVDELPKTSVGKHDKKVMREMYADQTEV